MKNVTKISKPHHVHKTDWRRKDRILKKFKVNQNIKTKVKRGSDTTRQVVKAKRDNEKNDMECKTLSVS